MAVYAVCIIHVSLTLYSIAVSQNGWTDGKLALHWIIDNFDAVTKEKAEGQSRLLLLDGHCSHYTPELLQRAQAANIIILAYPPHCTHALQGLDVVCFGVMKQYWAEEVLKFEKVCQHRVAKEDFASVFAGAYT